MKMTITPADMKALETRFMAENHIPGALLMEHAALGVVDAIARYTDKGTVVFLCGPGNNGATAMRRRGCGKRGAATPILLKSPKLPMRMLC